MSRTKVVFWVALVFAIFQLSIPVFVLLIDLQLRAIHVIFGISTALLAFSFTKAAKDGTKLSPWDFFLIGIVLVANINIFLKCIPIYTYPGESTTIDLILGCALALIVLDAARRTIGWAIPILVVLMLSYTFLGPIMPGMWKHPALPWDFVINSVYYSPLGIYGSVTGMSATFIAMFIIFGALLSATGGGRTFIDLALLLTGRFRGGPAKAAVIASAMFGSISGSSVANVTVTGNYTIPLMKRLGYDPSFAGGVEAMASTGGGVTPPIMSITAFIMAEFLGIPYIKIIGFALIPCLLFYTGVFSGVHFETVRRGLARVPEEELPHWRSVLTFSRLGSLFIPIVVLLYLLMGGLPLITAGFYACVAVAALFMFSNFSLSGMKERLLQLGRALSEGGQNLARLVPILVAVNILVNLIGITGVAPKVSGLIVDLGGEYLVLALMVASIVPLLLGTSLTVVPCYLLCVALLAPALMHLQVDMVAGHLFFIYWSVLGGVTPPVCLTAMVAAGIAQSNWLKTALISVRLGVVAFIVPYFFVLNPALVARGAPIDVLLYTSSALAGAILLAFGFFGSIKSRINIPLRLSYLVSGFLLFSPSNVLSLVAISIAIPAFVIERFVVKRFQKLKEGSDVRPDQG